MYHICVRQPYPNELYHHGVKGQRWGVRRYQNSDGSLTEAGYRHYGYKNLKKAKTANLDKWGTDSKHNVLYITGYSGSGKSTVAMSLANKNDTTIHLDAYSEPDENVPRNAKFDKYLDSKVPNWRDAKYAGTNRSKIKKHSKEYWQIIDNVGAAIEKYGAKEWSNNNKVIVEGVQITDKWLHDNYNYYKGRPVIVLGTNPITSMSRAFKRDGRGNLIVGLKNLDSAKNYIEWYMRSSKNLKILSKDVGAGKQYLRKHPEIFDKSIY